MFQEHKYVAAAFVLTIAAIIATIFLPSAAEAFILILVLFGLSGLVLQSSHRSVQRSRSDYDRLLGKLERTEDLVRDISVVQTKKFAENEARLRQVASLVKQIELSTRRLSDARESEEAVTSELVPSDARGRASVELKFRLLEDLADVREMVHELKLDADNRQNQES